MIHTVLIFWVIWSDCNLNIVFILLQLVFWFSSLGYLFRARWYRFLFIGNSAKFIMSNQFQFFSTFFTLLILIILTWKLNIFFSSIVLNKLLLDRTVLLLFNQLLLTLVLNVIKRIIFLTALILNLWSIIKTRCQRTHQLFSFQLLFSQLCQLRKWLLYNLISNRIPRWKQLRNRPIRLTANQVAKLINH